VTSAELQDRSKNKGAQSKPNETKQELSCWTDFGGLRGKKRTNH